MLSNVDFPDPEEPMIETNSPLSMLRLIPFSTCNGCPLSYVLWMFFSSISMSFEEKRGESQEDDRPLVTNFQ